MVASSNYQLFIKNRVECVPLNYASAVLEGGGKKLQAEIRSEAFVLFCIFLSKTR